MATFVGRKVTASPLPIRRQPLRLPLPLLIVWWILKLLAKVLWVTARSPAAITHPLSGSQLAHHIGREDRQRLDHAARSGSTGANSRRVSPETGILKYAPM
jgi:hypothetical protein